MLDLYQRRFEGRPLGRREYVLCADEKTSIQAREPIHATVAVGPGRPALVEHEYARRGALAYLACLDVHHPRLVGRCEERSGIEPFDRLVEQVMLTAPYCAAERVFLIVDNGSCHRGQASNQIEICFSILQRKLLQPNDFADLASLERAILGFERRYAEIAKPFDWKFTRADLHRLLARVASAQPAPLLLAA